MKITKGFIQIPVDIVEETDGVIGVYTNVSSKSFLGNQLYYGTGKTLQEAEDQFWKGFNCMQDFYKERSHQLDLWKPFQKGNWGHIGGTWFTIFGINVYFRYGKNMQFGWYIPFTNRKLNISVYNYWRRKYRAKK